MQIGIGCMIRLVLLRHSGDSRIKDGSDRDHIAIPVKLRFSRRKVTAVRMHGVVEGRSQVRQGIARDQRPCIGDLSGHRLGDSFTVDLSGLLCAVFPFDFDLDRVVMCEYGNLLFQIVDMVCRAV